METYTVTFQGYCGKQNLSVQVEATSERMAEYWARLDNPGWFTVLSVTLVESATSSQVA